MRSGDVVIDIAAHGVETGLVERKSKEEIIAEVAKHKRNVVLYNLLIKVPLVLSAVASLVALFMMASGFMVIPLLALGVGCIVGAWALTDHIVTHGGFRVMGPGWAIGSIIMGLIFFTFNGGGTFLSIFAGLSKSQSMQELTVTSTEVSKADTEIERLEKQLAAKRPIYELTMTNAAATKAEAQKIMDYERNHPTNPGQGKNFKEAKADWDAANEEWKAASLALLTLETSLDAARLRHDSETGNLAEQSREASLHHGFITYINDAAGKEVINIAAIIPIVALMLTLLVDLALPVFGTCMKVYYTERVDHYTQTLEKSAEEAYLQGAKDAAQARDREILQLETRSHWGHNKRLS